MTNALDHSIGKNQWPVLEKFLYYSGSLDHRTDGRLLLDPSLPVSIRFAIERTARFEANRLGELGKGPNIPRAEKELATILATVMGERLLFGLENPQLGQGTGGVNLVPLVWQSLSFVTATVRYIVIHRQQLDLESIAEEILPEIRAIAKSENENRGRTGLLEYIAEGSMGLDSFFAARNEADLVEFFSTADPDSLFRP